MLELSLHILDIVENSTRAGASKVDILIEENTLEDRLTLSVCDNGRGMDKEALEKLIDPFFTTKTVRKVGLGVPLLAQAAQAAGGRLTVDSEPGRGTRLVATFALSHPDRQPLGDMAATMVSLIIGNPGIDFVYQQRKDDREYLLDTRVLARELEGLDLTDTRVLSFIRDDINENLSKIGSSRS